MTPASLAQEWLAKTREITKQIEYIDWLGRQSPDDTSLGVRLGDEILPTYERLSLLLQERRVLEAQLDMEVRNDRERKNPHNRKERPDGHEM